jgi:hypothetical protein
MSKQQSKKVKLVLNQQDVKERTNTYALTNYEKETIFNFNEEEKTASIYTYNKALIKKLDKMCETHPKLYNLDKTDIYGKHISKTYTVPKKMISVRMPVERKPLTEEQKNKLRQRMKKMRTQNN